MRAPRNLATKVLLFFDMRKFFYIFFSFFTFYLHTSDIFCTFAVAKDLKRAASFATVRS